MLIHSIVIKFVIQFTVIIHILFSYFVSFRHLCVIIFTGN